MVKLEHVTMKHTHWIAQILIALAFGAWFSTVAMAQDIPILIVEGAQAQAGTTLTLEVVLERAPQGLQQYAFSLETSDPTIAALSDIEGVALSGQFFQVSGFSAERVTFRALDLENGVREGDENVVLARVTLDVLAPGSAELSLSVDAYVDDRGVKVDPQIVNGVVTVSGPGSAPTPPATAGPSPIPPLSSPPQDLDGDGLYEDVNGDGQLNSDDAALLLSNVNTPSVQLDKDFFDFNQDGQLNNDDVSVLLALSSRGSAPPPTDEAKTATVLSLQDVRANLSDTIAVNLVLAQAPSGLERFDVRITLAPAGVARFVGVRGAALGTAFLQVVALSDTEVRFRAADLENAVTPGATDVVLAQLQLQGIDAGTAQLDLKVELFTGEDGQRIAPTLNPAQLEVFRGPSALEPGLGTPQDLDGDGLFEDVNGDGVFNAQDAVLFSFHLDDPVVLANLALFDFNGDGQITFADATALNAKLG